MTMPDLKLQARQIFHQALRHVDVRAATARSLQVERDRLSAAGTLFNLTEFSNILIVAIGKAATPMYEAAAQALNSWPASHLRAIVVSPHSPRTSHGSLTFFPGAHPTPDETSRQAAVAILDFLYTATDKTLVLFLISGGSSAMVELPLDPAISTADIASFNRVLVGSGLSITEINSLRKHLSAVKGGRLAVAATTAAQCSLILSDVPANALDTVGSGPSLPDSSSAVQCDALYRRLRTGHALPRSIDAFFDSVSTHDTPKPDHSAFSRASWNCILSSDDLAAGAATAARALGFHIIVDNGCDEWPYREAATYLLDRCASLSQQYGRTCLISVGEIAVALTGASGRGGRNQQFALQCALQLADTGKPTAVLSAGSDGIDGNSPAAGAIADYYTCRLATLLGIDPRETLQRFDSFRLFDALGDTIITGQTGNNLRDLRLLLT